jgi:hypothetical protein
LGENWEDNAQDEDFQDDDRCLDYLHRFKTIKLLQAVLEEIGTERFLGAFVSFDSIKNCGYTYNEIISTCTDHLIDREDFIQNHDNGGVGDDEGGAFANLLGLAGHGAAGEVAQDGQIVDTALLIDPGALEQQAVAEAIQRSEETAAEDEQIRQVIAATVDDHNVNDSTRG